MTIPSFEYKKFKKIKSPSLFYLINDTKRTRQQLQVDLIHDFGNIVRLPFFSPCFAIQHPDYIKHIFLTHQHNYIKSDKNYRGLIDLVGEGIITNNGEKWRDQRLNLAPLFQPQKFADYIPTMRELSQQTKTRWEYYAQKKQIFNLTHEIMSLTLRISLKNFLTENGDEHFINLVIAFSQSMNQYVGKARYLFQFLPLPSLIKLKKQKKEIDSFLLALIKKRKTLSSPPHDLLTQLLFMRNNQDKPLNETEILGELKNFLVASYETVAHALTWTWYNLIRYPEIQEKVKNEIILKESLLFTQSVIEESIRLYPPAWIITRRALNSDEMDGHFIPAGSELLIYPYAIHRHPDFWEEPEKFWPERFTEENKKERHRYSYIPFGAGPRMCIASHLALLEAQVILSELLPHLSFHLTHKKEVKTQAFITFGIKNGLWVLAK